MLKGCKICAIVAGGYTRSCNILCQLQFVATKVPRHTILILLMQLTHNVTLACATSVCLVTSYYLKQLCQLRTRTRPTKTSSTHSSTLHSCFSWGRVDELAAADKCLLSSVTTPLLITNYIRLGVCSIWSRKRHDEPIT